MIKIISFGSGSSGNCALVENENTKLLLDVGISKEKIQKALMKNKLYLTDIDALLLTHIHSDHIYALSQISDYEIKTYCSEEIIKKYGNARQTALKHLKMIKINTIDVIPIRVSHEDTECYAFILHDKDSMILFATDFMYMEANLKSFKFNEIYIETNYLQDRMNKALKSNPENIFKLKRQINAHQSVENAIRFLEKLDLSNCNKIVGIHLSREFSDYKIIKEMLYNKFNINSYIFNSKGDLC